MNPDCQENQRADNSGRSAADADLYQEEQRQRDARSAEQKQNERLDAVERRENILMGIAIAAAVATVAQAVIGYFQLDSMNNQLKEIRGAAPDTRKLVDAAEASANAAKTTAKSSGESLQFLREHSAEQLRTQREVSMMDVRPWVGPVAFGSPTHVDGNKLVYVKAGERSLFTVSYLNSGRSPANKTILRVGARILPRQTAFNPEYTGLQGSPPISIILPGLSPRSELLFPVSGQPPFNEGQVQLLKWGEWILYFYGRIDYVDHFGRAHVTKFCQYLDRGLTALASCTNYNDAN